MILVDTSVWIHWLNQDKKRSPSADELLAVCTCGPVIQELLQGIRDGAALSRITKGLLALPRLADPLPVETFTQAAELYRMIRRKGYTIRSSMDCLIATIAINADVAICHADRDYDVIAKCSALRTVSSLS